MKGISALLSLVACFPVMIHAQSFFSITPDFGGDDMEGMIGHLGPTLFK
jgi:hypothetical protein